MLGISKEQIASVVESLDRFTKTLERQAVALEKIAQSHAEYVDFSRKAAEISIAFSERAMAAAEEEAEEEAETSNGKKGVKK